MKKYTAIGALLLVGISASGCKAEPIPSVPTCLMRGSYGECLLMIQDGRIYDVAPSSTTSTVAGTYSLPSGLPAWPTSSSGGEGGIAGFEEDILNTAHIPCYRPHLSRFSMCGAGLQTYFDNYEAVRAAADKAEADCLSVVVVNAGGHVMHATGNTPTRCDW